LNETNCYGFLEYFKEELAQALIECNQYEQEYLSKLKSLKKAIYNLSFEKEVLQKLNSELHTRIETLDEEKEELQFKCEGLQKSVLKFSKGQDNLDKLLGS